MLEKRELLELFQHIGTPEAGRKLILGARSQAPVRPVKSHGCNLITLVSSMKMQREIATESKGFKFAAAITFEYDAKILEYYAQPCELKFEWTDDATGEIHRLHHFPDFLTIDQDGFTLIETKSDAKLQKLAQKYPWRYKLDSAGSWYSPALEDKLSDLGIQYRIMSEKSLPPRRFENIRYLADYFCPACEPCPDDVLNHIHEVLEEHGCVYVSELLAAPHNLDPDHINKAIADKAIVTDFDIEKLTHPGQSRVFRDQMLMEFVHSEDTQKPTQEQERYVVDLSAGKTFTFGNQTLEISLVAGEKVICTDETGGVREISKSWILKNVENKAIQLQGEFKRVTGWAHISKENLQIVNKRLQILEQDSKNVSQRTKRRWRADVSHCRAGGSAGDVASAAMTLVPRISARGNRQPRLDAAAVQAIEEVFASHWSTSTAKNYKACYAELKLLCVQKGIVTPSYPTMIDRFKAIETNHHVRMRNGKRAAYQEAVFIDVLNADMARHGSRPFEYVHIDHTLVDIELICSETGKPLGRPWLTLVIDAFTRRVLAFYLSFDAPSSRAVLMVMREFVRPWQRLPEMVVVDNGKELVGSPFLSFLHSHNVHLRKRPAAQPRFGAVMERIFGRLHSEYVHNLAGNTKAMRNVRMTAKKFLPENLAEWTLENLHYGIEHWAYEY